MILTRFKHLLADALFPMFCLGCDREGAWVCEHCMTRLATPGVFCCPVCHCQTTSGEPCRECASKTTLRREVAALPYHEQELIGSIIHAYKFQYVTGLETVFRQLLETFVRNHTQIFSGVHAFVPVPLHRRRYAERGFNQAEALARMLTTCTGAPTVPLLKRSRHTPHQSMLGREKRLENVHSAFVVDTKIPRVGGELMIVDDVFTTGSTIFACVDALRDAGYETVSSVTLARG